MTYTLFNSLYSIKKYMEPPGVDYYKGFEYQNNNPNVSIDPALKRKEQSYNTILADLIHTADTTDEPNKETIHARSGLREVWSSVVSHPVFQSRIIVNSQWQYTMKSFWFDTAFRIDNNTLTLPWIQKEIPVGSESEALAIIHAINAITYYSRKSATSANKFRYMGKYPGLAPEVFLDTKTGGINIKGVIKDGVIMKSRFWNPLAQFIVDAINTRSSNATQRIEAVMQEKQADEIARQKAQEELQKRKKIDSIKNK